MKKVWAVILGLAVVLATVGMAGQSDSVPVNFYSPEFDVTVSATYSVAESRLLGPGYVVYLVDTETREEIKLGTIRHRKGTVEKITNRCGFHSVRFWETRDRDRVEGVWIVDVDNPHMLPPR